MNQYLINNTNNTLGTVHETGVYCVQGFPPGLVCFYLLTLTRPKYFFVDMKVHGAVWFNFTKKESVESVQKQK